MLYNDDRVAKLFKGAKVEIDRTNLTRSNQRKELSAQMDLRTDLNKGKARVRKEIVYIICH